jgi:hypothetical protein
MRSIVSKVCMGLGELQVNEIACEPIKEWQAEQDDVTLNTRRAETESPANECASQRPKLRFDPAAAALPVNSQPVSIAGQWWASTRSAARLAVCFTTRGTSPIEGDQLIAKPSTVVERPSLRGFNAPF